MACDASPGAAARRASASPIHFGALAAVLLEAPEADPHPLQVLITTVHQTFGAVLLAATIATVALHARLVTDGEPTEAAAAGVSG